MIIVRFKGRAAFHALAGPKEAAVDQTRCGHDVPARHERHHVGEPTCLRCRYALGLQPKKNDAKIDELARSIEKLIARANRNAWKPKRLRGELRNMAVLELEEGLDAKVWYAAVRRASGGKGIRALPDPRQLLLDSMMQEKRARKVRT